VTPDEWRRVRGEQDIIVRYEPERAIAALPTLLRDPVDRAKLVTLVRRLLADERVQRSKPSSEQIAMLENIGERLDVAPRRSAAQRTGARAKPAAKRKPAVKRKPAATRKPAAKPKPAARATRGGARRPSAKRSRARA